MPDIFTLPPVVRRPFPPACLPSVFPPAGEPPLSSPAPPPTSPTLTFPPDFRPPPPRSPGGDISGGSKYGAPPPRAAPPKPGARQRAGRTSEPPLIRGIPGLLQGRFKEYPVKRNQSIAGQAFAVNCSSVISALQMGSIGTASPIVGRAVRVVKASARCSTVTGLCPQWGKYEQLISRRNAIYHRFSGGSRQVSGLKAALERISLRPLSAPGRRKGMAAG